MQEMQADAVLIPGSGRSPERGNSNSLQYPCLKNPMDRGACRLQFTGSQESDTTKCRRQSVINHYTLVNMLTIIVTVLQCRGWGISPHWDSSLSVILWWKKESWALKQGKGNSLSLSFSLFLCVCVCVCVCVVKRDGALGSWRKNKGCAICGA